MASMFQLSQQMFAYQQNVVANGTQHTLVVFTHSITVSAVQGGTPAGRVSQPAQKSAQPALASQPLQLAAPVTNTTKKEVVVDVEPRKTSKPEWFSKNADITTIDPAAPASHKPRTSPFASLLKGAAPKSAPSQAEKPSSRPQEQDFWNRPSWA